MHGAVNLYTWADYDINSSLLWSQRDILVAKACILIIPFRPPPLPVTGIANSKFTNEWVSHYNYLYSTKIRKPIISHSASITRITVAAKSHKLQFFLTRETIDTITSSSTCSREEGQS